MNLYSMVYPLTTKWRSCGGIRPHVRLLRHYDCFMVSYLAYLCAITTVGRSLSYLAFWCLGGGGVSSAHICRACWRGGGGGDGVLLPHLLC
jgi:hypothetical protein